MNDSVVDLQQRRQEPAQTPGKRLREAREARKLSVENVARQLYLPDQTIRAIEDDDLSRLPHPTFVKGYLRNYARLVGLSEQDVRLDYPETPALAQQTVLEDETLINKAGYRFGSLAVLIPLILVGVLGWWIAGSDQASLKSPEPAPGLPESPLSFNDAPASPPPPPAPSAPPAETAPPQAPAAAAPSNPPAGDQPAPAAPSAPPVAAAPAPAAPPPDQSTLALNFTGDSWATIVDATGKKLFYQMGAQGTTKSVEGKPPFKVTLGRPANVGVEFNGQPFDHHSDNGKPVRLVIGANGR